MGDRETILSSYDRDEKVMAAAQHIVRVMENGMNLTEDVKKALADLNTRLSTMTLHININTRELNEIKEQLNCAREKIISWDSNDMMVLWDSGLDGASEYINSVSDVQQVAKYVRGLALEENWKHDEILCQAENLLQISMERLEKEMVYILVQHRQPFNSNNTSSRNSHELASSEEGLVHESRDKVRSSSESECFIADLIPPDAIPVLKSVADVMFAAKYDQEITEAYVSTQKEALDECLAALGMESFTMEELLKMDWCTLQSKIKIWVKAIKTFVHHYLPGENRLCDQIFGDFGNTKSVCFTSITRSLMVNLLNFGEAVAMGPRRPEKMFCLLDMYEVLADLRPDICTLFSEDVGSVIRTEFLALLKMLGDSAKSTFLEFGSFILSDPTVEPYPSGRVHGLTSYVMNHMTTLSGLYSGTINLLLEEDHELAKMVPQDGTGDNISARANHLFAYHLRPITTSLESNLEKKSQLYKEVSLRHIFLMNNIHYIVQKLKGSELRAFFDDDWIKMHIVSYQQHARSYVRVTWGPVVDGLRDEGNSGSDSAVRIILKERLRNFNAAFEDVYKVQSGWSVQDGRLKEELQISISQRLVLAYQSFVGRCKKYDLERYIKYDADDLVDHLSDLFEGSQKSLSNLRRK